MEQRRRKTNSFEYYLNYEYPNISAIQRQDQLIGLLGKYNQLSNSQKKEYAVHAYLKDSEFIGRVMGFGMNIKFKGKSTALLTVMGMTVGTTYTVDEDQIRIDPTAGSYPMPLSIEDDNTMIGQSLLGECTFKRIRH